ncbi:MFS transporter [Brachybacterium nesterenkovii]|uniref:Probable 3-phenylpropionic acid transporter n=1 Tax=Brachybacterium nesterenkovii TaxID=47847 RepID=A0A1X6WT96_9MICO|nr:MFS transporter [Brachybacterium nesterenkovii]SLM88195.1 Probable 3-phenylpropionic acid transporter [Brachybacterium nesterenkovii]
MSTWMRIQFFAFFFTWATFISDWAPIFTERGFDSSRVGLAITVSLVTRALAVVLLFPLVNRFVPLGTMLKALPWLCLAGALAFLPHTGFTALVVLSAVFGVLYPTAMPALETTASLGAQRGSLVYGPTRMWGSAGFIVGAGVDGAVQQLFGTPALLLVFIGGIAAMAVTALLPLGDAQVAAQRSGSLGSWGPLFTRPVFVLALAVSVLVQSSHAAYYTFGTLHAARLGAAPVVVAALLIIAPLGELVVFRVTGSFAERWSLAALMGTAVAGSVVRWVLWALVPSVPLLLVSQVLHGLTFGMLQVGFVQTLRRQVSPGLVAPAQGLYNALGTGVGTAVMTVIAGHWFDSSPLLAFAAMIACALAAVPLTLALARRERVDGADHSPLSVM